MTTAVILAGGNGRRFHSSIPKQLMSLNGKAVIQYSIDVLEPLVDEIIIVFNGQYKDYKCVAPGITRNESAYNGVIASKGDYVLIHDGARPFIRTQTVEEIMELLSAGFDAVDTISPIVDGYVQECISKNKKGRFLGLTPEGFKKKLLIDAFYANPRRDWQDEFTMVQSLYPNGKYGFVEGQSFNSKITYEEDLAYAEGIMKFWREPIDTIPALNRNTLLLGGSGGIGQACIKRLHNYNAPSHKELDLSRKWDVKLKPYKAIIHTAGEYKNRKKIMPVNFDSCVRLVELAQEQKWKGNIVFLSSTASTYGRKGIALYSASKSALNAYIESKHEELAKQGIYINAIAPAKVDTPLQTSINPDASKSSMMTPDYVADFVLRYIDTKAHGDIIFLRKGFDG